MEGIRNFIQREIARALAKKAFPRLGLIDSYDPSTASVKVSFPDDGKLSGWMPIGTAIAGNGWGLHTAPVIGAQCCVNFHDGDPDSPFMSHQIWSKTDRPLSVPSGDIWLQHSNGLTIRIQASGQVEIGASASAMHKLVTDALILQYNNHTHGGGPKPDTELTDAELTQYMVAN